MILERGTHPKRSRRTCTCEYGLHSCRGESAGVAKRPRERSATRNLPRDRTDSQRFHPSLCSRGCCASLMCGAGAQVLPDVEVGTSPGGGDERLLTFYLDGAHTEESMLQCAAWFAQATQHAARDAAGESEGEIIGETERAVRSSLTRRRACCHSTIQCMHHHLRRSPASPPWVATRFRKRQCSTRSLSL
jgi:hypothetical protein